MDPFEEKVETCQLMLRMDQLAYQIREVNLLKGEKVGKLRNACNT
jgi:hypothetical protein